MNVGVALASHLKLLVLAAVLAAGAARVGAGLIPLCSARRIPALERFGLGLLLGWGSVGCAFLGLARMPEPELPSPSWVRVRPLLSGICGSDTAAITAQSSLYLPGLTSFPFVPGHEVVGRVEAIGPDVHNVASGDRVVMEPALGCRVRGFAEPCRPCREGHDANCQRVTEGDIAPGIQTGYCRDTGGGWSGQLVAHESQLHRVPDGLSDEAAVLAEPLSCALHAVLQAELPAQAQVLVVGAGSVGLLTMAALRFLHPDCTIVAMARYPHQQEAARSLGADHLVPGGPGAYAELARLAGGSVHALPLGKPVVMGGFDVAFECVGAQSSLEDALRWTRPQGQVVLVGMPAPMQTDLAPLWYQEIRLTGAYAYGLETWMGRRVRSFDIGLEMLSDGDWAHRLEALVRHRFPLRGYRRAIATALRPGRSGAIKTVFDLRGEAQ